MTTSKSTTNCTCRKCGVEMETKRQDAQTITRADGRTHTMREQNYVTCWNASCSLSGFTFDKTNYETVDLAAYEVAR